jgi:hypothetical protein
MTLKISYPSIFTNGVEERILSGAEVYGTDITDVFNGERTSRPYLGPSGGTISIAVDLGLGSTATADHVIISHAGAYTTVTTINLYNSNTSITSGYGGLNSAAISGPSSVSKVGPRAEDYYQAINMSTPARFWNIELACSTAADVKAGKIYLGNGLDLGREPAYQFERVPLAKADARNTGGGFERNISTEYVYRFQFEWERITDANTQAFFDYVAEGATRDRFFLYTTANHHILNNERLVHCKLLEARSDNSSQRSNYNTITAEFEEIIG